MDRERHITQDAAEHYAVYVMAKTAEDLGVAKSMHSRELWASFVKYLGDAPRNWALEDFTLHYPQYKRNVDAQIPQFVVRLKDHFPTSTFEFAIDEATFRRLGLKADFTIAIDTEELPHFVSLKNYVGPGGILRPQVSSGTFLSFAAGFVFDRDGVGTYTDPRTGLSFRGNNKSARDAVLRSEGRDSLIEPLQVLDELQRYVREQLLCLRFYDGARVAEVVVEIVPKAQAAILKIFDLLGLQTVRRKFLERAGLDGTEEVLYFDNSNFLDSITNTRFSELRAVVNNQHTEFRVRPAGQALRFEFIAADGAVVLPVDVPLTINTNGAWYRPAKPYSGERTINDKGHRVALKWGELRPYKSREIATSTNTYVNLQAAGIFVK